MIRGVLLTAMVLLATVLLSTSIVAQTATDYSVNQYLLVVHEDGSVDVYIRVIVSNPPADITIPVIGTPIFYEAYTKDAELPITYDNGVLTVTVYYNNATVHYVTVETTSKTGDLWTLAFNAQWTCTVILPDNAVIVSIEPSEFTPVIINGTLGFMFSPGQINITYILMPIVTTTTTTTTTTPTATTTATTTPPTMTTTTTTTTTTSAPTTTISIPTTGTHTTTTTTTQSTLTTTTTRTLLTTQTTQTTTQPSQPQQNTTPLIALGIIAIAIIAGALFMLRGKKSKGNSGPAEIDYSRLDERDKAILKALEEHGELTGRELMEITGIPKTPFYRKLKKLIDMGLIEYRDVEGVRRYRLKK